MGESGSVRAGPVWCDQEGGGVGRFKPRHGKERPAAARFGALYGENPEAAREAAYLNARLMAAELAALGDLAEQTAAGGMILLVLLQGSGGIRNFLCEDRDLDLRGAGVILMKLAVGDQLLLCFALEGHGKRGK